MITAALTGISFVAGIVTGIIGTRAALHSRKKHKQRINAARTYYGQDWKEAIQECDQKHADGECVLCGGSRL